jgi:hypothetical protein
MRRVALTLLALVGTLSLRRRRPPFRRGFESTKRQAASTGVGHVCLGVKQTLPSGGVMSADGRHLLPVSEDGVSATSAFKGHFSRSILMEHLSTRFIP